MLLACFDDDDFFQVLKLPDNTTNFLLDDLLLLNVNKAIQLYNMFCSL